MNGILSGMKIKQTAGFTLIELLMVVAIIGILISITIVSISSARNKATDKAIVSNMVTLRSQAALYYDGIGAQSYGNSSVTCTSGLFSSDPVIIAAIAKLQTYTDVDHVVCSNTANSYAVASQLKSSNDYYCLDPVTTGKIVDVNSVQNGLIGPGAGYVVNTLTSLCN